MISPPDSDLKQSSDTVQGWNGVLKTTLRSSSLGKRKSSLLSAKKEFVRKHGGLKGEIVPKT